MKLMSLIPCVALALTCLLPLRGHAGEEELLVGRLQAVQQEDRTVVMDNVLVYVPEEVADLAEFSAGDEVFFEYRRKDGRLTAYLLRKNEEG